jgi:hypothetical protein
VWLEGLGKFKKFDSPHRVSNPRSFALEHSALPRTLMHIEMNAIVEFEVLITMIMKISHFSDTFLCNVG